MSWPQVCALLAQHPALAGALRLQRPSAGQVSLALMAAMRSSLEQQQQQQQQQQQATPALSVQDHLAQLRYMVSCWSGGRVADGARGNPFSQVHWLNYSNAQTLVGCLCMPTGELLQRP